MLAHPFFENVMAFALVFNDVGKHEHSTMVVQIEEDIKKFGFAFDVPTFHPSPSVIVFRCG